MNRQMAADLFKAIQSEICSALEKFEDSAAFARDEWRREDLSGSDGGGGLTRIMVGGTVFEQAGVNFSEVHGTLPKEMSLKLVGQNREAEFYATGVSIVVHPLSPLVPTTHANLRYLEVAEESWFGGGMDLTPYYLNEADAHHFHRTIKSTCDRHNPDYYPRFKKWCDEYFYLPHRQETRGVGGIFFDYLGKDQQSDPTLDDLYKFVADLGPAFIEAYTPIVKSNFGLPYTPGQKDFQLLRRGRYVEFNLLYDRGTLFGLRTGGRTESILMSLPPVVNWRYESGFAAGSEEAKLIETLRNPREWA